MDPLSVAASIITIVQVANAITIICLDASSKSSSTRLNIRRILDEVNALRTVLEGLARLLTDGDNNSVADLPNLQALAREDGPLSRCRIELEELQTELQRVVDTKSGMITWIFREKDVNARLGRISRVKQTLQLALTTDQTVIVLNSRMHSMAIRSAVDEVAAGAQRESILQWLGAVSSSSNLNAAQKLRTPTTGNWLLRGSTYAKWKISPRSLFWLHGIPGSGKTILCSSIVEDLKEMSILNIDMLVLYVFFDFSRQGSLVLGTFLRSILAQILVQTRAIPEAIISLYETHHNGFNHPGDHTLLDTIHTVLNDTRPTYLVVDALDECAERARLLGTLREIVDWNLVHLHILATSRPELDIDETMTSLGANQLSLEDQNIRRDIRSFVESTLNSDSRLQKWSDEVQEEITTVMLSKAGPMFRWVACQLEVLKLCMNLKRLREALQALPSTLDETYARILMRIDSSLTNDAFRVLSFLCFSVDDVTVEEVADVLAIDPETDEYEAELRIHDPADILKICGSLVTRHPTGAIHLSHYTVKEFLISDRILESNLKHFHIRERTAETTIAKAALIYLLYFDQQKKEDPSKRDAEFRSPFAAYSMRHWYYHFESAANVGELLPFVIRLLFKENSGFWHWGFLGSDGQRMYYPEARQLSSSNKANIALNIAAHLGCSELVEIALERGAEINNTPGVRGTPLNTACIRGHKAIVQVLLDMGANVNEHSSFYGSALQTAAFFGWLEIMSLLISRGADVNLPGGKFGAPILAAFESKFNCVEAVKLLLNAGCNLHVAGKYSGKPYFEERSSLLSIAAHRGIKPVVSLLLERNVNPNEDNSSALQCALDEMHIGVADVLIKKGADVNFSGGTFYSTIGAAVSGGMFSMQFLIGEHNADPSIRDLQGRTALHFAANAANGTSSHQIKYLLEIGMDVNDKDARGWSSIHYAVMNYYTEILEILKAHWKKDCVVSDNQWTPLHLACCFNGTDALDLLNDMGFEPTTVTTPQGHWTIYDIAVVYRNDRLVAKDGTPRHPLIAKAKAEPPEKRTIEQMREDMPEQPVRICDGCSPFSNSPMYGPAFHCKICPDFDYCFICMHDAHKAHPHSSWQVISPLPAPCGGASAPPQVFRTIEEESSLSEHATVLASDNDDSEILPDRTASDL